MQREAKRTVGFFQSVRGRITLLVALGSIILTTVIIAMTMPNARVLLKDSISNYMLDLAKSYGNSMEQSINGAGTEQMFSLPTLEGLYKGNGMSGVSSSYIYLVDGEGTMLYHPTAEKIGKPVENAVVSGLVEKIKAGNVPAGAAVTEYEFKGAIKYASYYVDSQGRFILVVSADEKEVLGSMTTLLVRGIVVGVIACLVVAIVLYLALTALLKPVAQLTESITKMTSLDLREDDTTDAIAAKRSEFGVIASSVIGLQRKLKETVTDLKQQSDLLYQTSEEMHASAATMHETTAEVNQAVAEISDGANSQANETQSATENVIAIGTMIEDTNAEVNNLRQNMRDMRSAQEQATEIIKSLGQVNQQTTNSIEEIAKQTVTTNESASKIREATALITDIAEETNLLSLNASIEAARAGEAGKGFAVVAGQIQKLAEQSNSSAKLIEEIIDKLISDSDEAVKIMDEAREIIKMQNDNVSQTDNIFNELSDSLNRSIASIRVLADKMTSMDTARTSVVDTVQNLTAIAEENAAGTEETSASVASISSVAEEIEGGSRALSEIAKELDDEVNRFTF